jgi:NADPH:quinone reductase-like Zn-dependent oxidoreductase
MRAAVHRRYGSPEVVSVTEVERPQCGDGELLVRVRATTVNRTDTATRSGSPFFARIVTGLARPKATILGNEYAGEVEAIGSAVATFEVGDRVFGYNEGPFGGHAEYLTVPADGTVARMPPDAPFSIAAAALEGSHYALSMIRRAKIQPGADVLVNGATGAIGSAAVQLLVERGVGVTAVGGTEHLDLVAGFGPRRVIDYKVEDFTSDSEQYDVVIDAVGKSSFSRCRSILKPGGTYVSSELGPGAQNPALALITPVLRRRKVIFPIPEHDGAMAREIADLMEAGTFSPLIDRSYPLEEIVEAHRYVETGQKVGNVVIDLG